VPESIRRTGEHFAQLLNSTDDAPTTGQRVAP
jgi:hypothetical protein